MYYLKDYWPGKIIESMKPYPVTEEELIEVGRRWDPRPYPITGVRVGANPCVRPILKFDGGLRGLDNYSLKISTD
jgi:hypothetical protein